MSIALMTAAWALDLPTGEKIVLLSLADNASDDGRCWPSMAQISKRAGMTARGAQLIVQRLVAAGHLTRTEVIGKGCNYVVHPRTTFASPPNDVRPEASSPPNETAQTPERRSDKSSVIIKEVQASPSPPVRSPKPNRYPVAFEDWWAAYPRKVGKADALKAYLNAGKALGGGRQAVDRLHAAATAYASHAPPDQQFIPHPATWLREGRYDDPIEELSNVRSMGRNDRIPPTGNVRTVAALDLVRQFGTAAQHDQPGDSGPDRQPRLAVSAWAR